jgi:hypothetical protein
MKSSKYIINNSFLDLISKFNFFDKFFLKKLDSIVFFSKVNLNDTNFLRDFFFLSRLFFFWFNKKICILHVISDKKRVHNKGKNSLTFFFGCTLRNEAILKNLDYINNILFFLTKKIDGVLNYKKINDGFVYSFSNVNFLLGFKSEAFFNLNLKINVFYNFFSKKKLLLDEKIKKDNKIINFYEKVFF